MEDNDTGDELKYEDQFVDLEKLIESVRKVIRRLNKAEVPISNGAAYTCRLAMERLAIVPAHAPDSWNNIHAYAALREELVYLTDAAVEHLANRLRLSYPKLKAGDGSEWEQALKGERVDGGNCLTPAMAAFAYVVEEQLRRLPIQFKVTYQEFSWIIGGTPKPGTIQNRMRADPNSPRPVSGGNGTAHSFLYTDLVKWFATAFPSKICPDESRARSDLLDRPQVSNRGG